MASFIQGFLATLTLDTVDITLTVGTFTFDESRTTLDKSVMDGTGESPTIPGKTSGTLTINGHISQAEWNSLETTWQKTVPVAFTFSPEQDATVDFLYTGNITLAEKQVSVDASSNWAFTISGATTDVVYTPHTP